MNPPKMGELFLNQNLIELTVFGPNLSFLNLRKRLRNIRPVFFEVVLQKKSTAVLPFSLLNCLFASNLDTLFIGQCLKGPKFLTR